MRENILIQQKIKKDEILNGGWLGLPLLKGRVQNNYLIILDSSYVFTYFEKNQFVRPIFILLMLQDIEKRKIQPLYI